MNLLVMENFIVIFMVGVLVRVSDVQAIEKALNDKIIVLNNGEVAEIGTHSTLMSGGGLYYNLYNAQKQTDDK